MGKARYIYFSDEVDKLLVAVPNRSALICELLSKHFKEIDYKQMNQDELKKAIKIEKIKREYESKIKEAQNG